MTGSALTRLHHVGIVVRDIQRAAEDLVMRFGYRPESSVIHDPLQTAFVQFFRLRNDHTLLELVAPDGASSKLAAAAKRRGGLHHLCFAVDDIDGTCKRLNAEGLLLIQGPVLAVAFPGRRIAWLLDRNHVLTELLEEGTDDWPSPS